MQDYLESKSDDFDGIATKRFLLGSSTRAGNVVLAKIDALDYVGSVACCRALETGQPFLEHYLRAYNFRETERGTEYKRDPDFPILPAMWSRRDSNEDERFDDAGETPDTEYLIYAELDKTERVTHLATKNRIPVPTCYAILHEIEARRFSNHLGLSGRRAYQHRPDFSHMLIVSISPTGSRSSSSHNMDLLFKIFLIIYTTVHTTWSNRAKEGKVSQDNIRRVIHSTALLPLAVAFLPVSKILKIFCITLAFGFWIVSTTMKTSTSDRVREDMKTWLTVVMICLTVTCLATLLMDYSNTKSEFEGMVLGATLLFFPPLYESIMRRLRGD